jgi:hypothetical protein
VASHPRKSGTRVQSALDTSVPDTGSDPSNPASSNPEINESIAPPLTLQRRVARRLGILSPSTWGILVILVLGFSCRYAAIDWGLPYPYPWDEPEIVHPAIRVLRNGTYRPESFAYGPMNTYVHAAWGVITFVRGVEKGHFKEIWEMKSNWNTGWYWSVTSPFFYQQARLLCVLFGCISILALYRTGVALGSTWAGLWAAAVLAFSRLAINQTSIVTTDASTMAAACVAIWASAEILRSRARWAYATATVAAALAAAFKYTSYPVILFPLLAHLLTARRPERRFFDVRLTWIIIGYISAAAVFMFPAFLDPTRFLHSLANEAGYYGNSSGSKAGILTAVPALLKHALISVEAGDYFTPPPSANALLTKGFALKVVGFPALVMLLLGLVQMARHNRAALWLLAIPAAYNIWFISGHEKTFFARNLLLAIHALALIGGLGWAAAARALANRLPSTRFRFSAPALSCALFVVLMGMPMARAAKNAWTIFHFVDPRLKLSQYMLSNLPEGTPIRILEETRWQRTPEEEKRFHLSTSSIPRTMANPPSPEEVRYFVAPKALRFYAPTPERDRFAEAMNGWLKKGKAVASFGRNKESPEEAMFFGRTSIEPRVMLIENTPELAAVQELPKDLVWGSVFDAGNLKDGIQLSRYGAVVQSGVNVEAPVEITRPATRATLRARGISPFFQDIPPAVAIEVYATTDTMRAAPLLRGKFELKRSTSGMQDYKFAVAIPPGVYIVRLRPSDAQSFLTDIEQLAFE